ncbi:MAG: FecR domain-containing protein [Opitutaceae bacterium]|nr:FecR domain-containing protein [Opitutaceae bacterium]
MNAPAEPSDPAARRAAAQWLARHDRGLTGAEQDEFLQWLASDPSHGAWFAKHRGGWERLDRIAAWHPQHGAEPNPDVLARPVRRTRWLQPVLLAAATVAIVAGTAVFYRLTAPGVERTATVPAGTYERRVLEDGTVVELTGGAELEINFSPEERRVALRHGEALFTVAKNPARPFIVRAGGVNVRAVGTAFNVRLGPERVEVLVTEGRVQVAPPSGAAAPPLVVAGELAVVSLAPGSAPQVAAASAADHARVRAWQPQLLDFPSTPLAEVIAELNRRNRVQLVLADPALGRLSVAASIRSDNLEGFVQLLATTARLRAEPQGDYRIVLRPAL